MYSFCASSSSSNADIFGRLWALVCSFRGLEDFPEIISEIKFKAADGFSFDSMKLDRKNSRNRQKERTLDKLGKRLLVLREGFLDLFVVLDEHDVEVGKFLEFLEHALLERLVTSVMAARSAWYSSMNPRSPTNSSML